MAEANWFDNEAALHELFHRAEKAVAGVAELVLGQAQRDAPVETGTLRGSGVVLPHEVVEPSRDAPTLLEETVAFPMVYAAKQEMDEEYNHPMGGKAHYLGDSVKAHAPTLQQAMEAVTK